MSAVLQQIVCMSCCLVRLVLYFEVWVNKRLQAESASPLEVYMSTRRVVTLVSSSNDFDG